MKIVLDAKYVRKNVQRSGSDLVVMNLFEIDLDHEVVVQ